MSAAGVTTASRLLGVLSSLVLLVALALSLPLFAPGALDRASWRDTALAALVLLALAVWGGR